MALAGGTAGAAGQGAWQSLCALVRRRPAAHSDGDEDAQGVTGQRELEELRASPDDTERARALARALAVRARQDAEFGQELDAWRNRHGGGSVNMGIYGGTQGTVVQAQHIGTLNVGRPERPGADG
ncbi:hypothetical protein GCM10010393_11000 [Streptomyces gobitricini]|uniref:Uncharacterized protein n=2 Tax=Streptomyces gobitricini TaxID=68211 RepID=A0ABP5YJI5_9ACTN